jgi:hypothetical protein
MSHVPELKPADKWIFAMAAFALVSIIVGTRLAHTHHELLGDIFFFLGFSSLWALPSIAALHIIFNEARSALTILWVESILVGILVMLAAQVLALNLFGDTGAAILSLTLAIAFALLPLFTRTHSN